MNDTSHPGALEARAASYDAWYETFEGAVEHAVDWTILTRHLPDARGLRILDAAGGTGRISLPLARLGHRVTLCDRSPAMLGVARDKVLQAGLEPLVDLWDCDVRRLPFPDDSFDFVICWNGGAECVRELARVARIGAGVSAFFVNRWAAAMARFARDAHRAPSEPCAGHESEEEEPGPAVDGATAEAMFDAVGIRPAGTYAVCGWMRVMQVPADVRESREWDERLFAEAVEMLLRLSREPSVRGVSKHVVVYGRRG